MTDSNSSVDIDWAALGFTDPNAPPTETKAELVICVNRPVRADRPSCGGRGGIALADALEEGIRSKRLPIKLTRINCFGWCSRGPNLRLVGGAALNHATLDDVPGILQALAEDPPQTPNISVSQPNGRDGTATES